MIYKPTEYLVKTPLLLRAAAITLTVVLWTLGGRVYAQKFDFRAVNLIDGGSAIDVHFVDRAEATIVNLAHESMSPISPGLPVLTGNYNVKYATTGAGLAGVIVGTDFKAITNTEFEGIAYGTSGSPKLAVLSRLKSKVAPAGQALLRVLNGTTLADSFDVYLTSLGDPPILTNIKRDSASKFATVPGTVSTLIITRNGSQQPITQLIVPLTPLSYNTLVISGSSVSSLKIHQINGALQGTAAVKVPVLQGSDVPLSFVRVVNAWPQKTVPMLDIYLDGMLRTNKLPYRSASERYGPLTADSVKVDFVTVGDSPGNSLQEVRIDLQPDTAYGVVLTQFDNGGRTHLLLKRSMTEKPSSPSGAKIRVANVTDFYGPVTIVIQPVSGESLRYEDIAFLSYTAYRDLPSGNVVISAYQTGKAEPIMTGNLTIPAGSLLTFLALGDNTKFGVDILNDSAATLQSPMRSFDPALSVRETYIAQGKALDFTSAPNPFSTSARLSFTLPRATGVTLRVIDNLGRTVDVPMTGERPEGRQEIEIGADRLAPGAYTCVLETEEGITAVRQIMVVK